MDGEGIRTVEGPTCRVRPAATREELAPLLEVLEAGEPVNEPREFPFRARCVRTSDGQILESQVHEEIRRVEAGG